MPFPIRVSDVMSSPVETIDVDETVAVAAAECFEKDIGSLVVTDEDVVGIVTGMDLLEALATTHEPGQQPVREVMSAPAITTSPETPVGQAVATMQGHEIARLVVLDDDELVGLVSTDDIIRYVPQVFHRYEVQEESDAVSNSYYQARPETAYEKDDWSFECSRLSETDTTVGDKVEFSKTLSEHDVERYAEVSGDTNRLHLEEAYAEETRFGKRIVHGSLVSGLISAALARLPGLTIYVSQDLSFLSPVEIGEQVTAACEIVGTFGQNKYELTTDVFDEDGQKVVEGEAAVLIDELPAE